jgi:hypothetical protein
MNKIMCTSYKEYNKVAMVSLETIHVRRSKRIKKKPIRYQDEYLEHTIERYPDDYAEDDHNKGHFDKDDVTFASYKYYKTYEYDNVSLSGSESSDDNIETKSQAVGGDLDNLSTHMENISLESDYASDDEYEASFVSFDMHGKGYEDEDPDYVNGDEQGEEEDNSDDEYIEDFIVDSDKEYSDSDDGE